MEKEITSKKSRKEILKAGEEITEEKSKELVAEKGLNAGTVIRELGKLIDGNGGGQPFFASGKGKNVAGIKEALEKVFDFVK